MTQKAQLTDAQRELLRKRLQGRELREPQTTIPRRKIHDRIPQSFAQQRLWFMDQLQPGNANYHIPFAIRMTGPLDVQALNHCINDIVQRHESLRTIFIQSGGTPVQVIVDKCHIDFESLDWSGLAAGEQENRTKLLLQTRTTEPFNLSEWPLMRVSLAKFAEHEYVFLIVMHHIVSDGWSMGIFWRELSTLYKGYIDGEEAQLPALDIQYPDYSCWQWEPQQIEKLQKGVSYWAKEIEGADLLLELPTDRPRPMVRGTEGAIQRRMYSLELRDKLKEVCQREAVTLFMLLLAVFKSLLFRYIGQERFLMGIGVANRNIAELEPLIGFFVNLLVFGSDFSGNPTFRQILERAKYQALAAYEYQDVPLEKLVEHVQPNRNLSHTPLFQVVFVLQNTSMKYQLSGMKLTELGIDGVNSNYDMTLSMTETDAGLLAKMEYSTALFDETTITRWNEHLAAVLHSVSHSLEQNVMDIPILNQHERYQILIEWNDNRQQAGREYLHRLIEIEAKEHPEAIAVEYGERLLTFGELNRRANQLAHWLRKRNIKPECRVAVAMQPGIELIIGQLAIMKAGGAFVPLDLKYPNERLRYISRNAKVSVAVADHHLAHRLSGIDIEVLDYSKARDVLNEEDTGNPIIFIDGLNPAYVIYTSGSTGRPKGVEVTHRGLNNLLHWHKSKYGITGADRGSQVAGVGFDASILEIWMCLGSGASICIVDSETRLDPPRMRGWLLSHGITICFLPPVLLEEVLLEHAHKDHCLRIVLTGGDRLSRYGREGQSFELFNLYGPTECTIVSTCTKVECKPGDTENLPLIGRGISNSKVYVLDRNMGLVPISVKGEVCVGGELLARGYLRDVGSTAEKFVPDPYSTVSGSRMYLTGDFGRYTSDGQLDFLGRIDHQVKIRGYRIELGEIESVLAEHEKVREGVVLANADRTGSKSLAAYVARKDASLSPGELLDFLMQRLPEYMVPANIAVMDALPLTANGKIDRVALQTHNWDADVDKSYPQTPVEEALAGIWKEVLRIERVGVHDRFFDLGGHSLLATQVATRIRHAFGIPFSLRSLFEKTTIAELAVLVEEEVIKQITAM